MTREELIQHEAWKYSSEIENRSYNGRPDWEDHRWAFEAGAAWADANPQWHKNDEIPEGEGLYLVLRQDIPIILYWNADEQCWDDPDEDDFVCTPKGVFAWMELPQPPKLD